VNAVPFVAVAIAVRARILIVQIQTHDLNILIRAQTGNEH